jgi:predicted nucleic acid-binding protein
VEAVLFDSSVYISALRGDPSAIHAVQRLRSSSALWLSAVVLEELFAGAGMKGQPAVERLQRDFGKARRILVPSLSDWADAGKVLGRVGSEYGYETIDRGRLTNDALIAISAGRASIKIITENARDFAKLAEFCLFTWSTP